MQTSTELHRLALVPSDTFVNRMVDHWSNLSGGAMPATPKLKMAWSISAEHYHDIAINNASNNPYKPSVVLPLPTGSGKTEGMFIYAALQAEANTKEDVIKVGVLIVTRLIKDAEKLVSRINAAAGRHVAATSHSDAKLTPDAMAGADILVITQAAFMNACVAFGAGDASRWDTLHSWDGGKRHLVVVDEALLNAVDEHKVTSASLKMVLRALPHEVRAEHAAATETLVNLQRYLDAQEQEISTDENAQTVPLWGTGSTHHAEEIVALRGALGYSVFGRDLFVKDAKRDVAAVLESVQIMLEEFAYYRRAGVKHTLNSARYTVPKGMPGTVVLDATAGLNMTMNFSPMAVA